MIVSHLNANSNKGMQWIDDVIINGLQSGDASANWKIEIHGGDGETESASATEDNNDTCSGLTVMETANEEPDDDDDDRYGPAVYIIQKVNRDETSGQKQECESKESKVALKFFGY